MKQIVIVKPGTVSSRDKERLTKAGMICIEHPNPDEVRIVKQASDSQFEDLAMAGLHAAEAASKSMAVDASKVLVAELNNRLKIKQQKGEKG